jgi:uncharacterized protein
MNPFETPQDSPNVSQLTNPTVTVAPPAISTDNTLAVDPTSNVPCPQKHRLWTLLVTFLTATVIYLVTSVLSVVLMTVIYMTSSNSSSLPEVEELLTAFSSHPAALWVLVMPGQLAILVVTVCATLFSPEKFTQRLAIHRPSWPLWITVAAVFASPFISFLWVIPLSAFVQNSEHLESMANLFRNAGQGIGIIGLFLCVAVLPALSEEWLFRGYIQSRLLKRWHPFWAIAVSSLLFAGFHMDPVHVIAVLPLGLWLGTITYYSGSIIPAMLAHAYNNALSIVATVYLGSEAMNSEYTSPENVIVLATGAPGLLIALGYVAWQRRSVAAT